MIELLFLENNILNVDEIWYWTMNNVIRDIQTTIDTLSK